MHIYVLLSHAILLHAVRSEYMRTQYHTQQAKPSPIQSVICRQLQTAGLRIHLPVYHLITKRFSSRSILPQTAMHGVLGRFIVPSLLK